MNALIRRRLSGILSSSIIFFAQINLCHAQSWVPDTDGMLDSYQWNRANIYFKPDGPFGKDWIYGHYLDQDSVVRCVGYREGGKWKALPFTANYNSFVTDIELYGDTMYMGGNFNGAIWDKDSSILPSTTVLKFFNDSIWSTAIGVSALVELEASGDTLIIAGNVYVGPNNKLIGPHVITTDGGLTWASPYSVPYPGTTSGLGGPWDKVEIRRGNIYTINTEGTTTKGVVKWNGLQWNTFGQGLFGPVAQVYDFEFYQNDLYIGGSFDKQQDFRNPGKYIAKRDGANWQEIGGGLDSPPWSLFTHKGILYCHTSGKQFGDANISYLAGWDGHQWCGTPTNFVGGDPPVNFGFVNDTLWAVFKNPGSHNRDPLSYLNYFDGDYVKGPNAICSTLGIGMEESAAGTAHLKIFPNPASSLLSISLAEEKVEQVKIYNLSGKCVLEKSYEGRSSVEVDITNLTNGVYLIEVNGQYNEKVVKM